MPVYHIDNDDYLAPYSGVILDTDQACMHIVFRDGIFEHEREECLEALYVEIQGWDDDTANAITDDSLIDLVNAQNGLTSLPMNLNHTTWQNFKEVFSIDTSEPPGSEMEAAINQTFMQGVVEDDAVIVANSAPRVFLQSLDDFLPNHEAERTKILRAIKLCIDNYEADKEKIVCPISQENLDKTAVAIMLVSARGSRDRQFAMVRQFNAGTHFPDDLSYHADLVYKDAAMEESLANSTTANLAGYGNAFLKFDFALDAASIAAFKEKYLQSLELNPSDSRSNPSKKQKPM